MSHCTMRRHSVNWWRRRKPPSRKREIRYDADRRGRRFSQQPGRANSTGDPGGGPAAQGKEAALADAAAAKAEVARLQEEVRQLQSERKQVRTRIEKLLGQIDQLSAS